MANTRHRERETEVKTKTERQRQKQRQKRKEIESQSLNTETEKERERESQSLNTCICVLSWTDDSVDCNVCVHNILSAKLFLSGIKKKFFIKCGGKRKIIKNDSVILMFHQACQWNRNMIKCMAKTIYKKIKRKQKAVDNIPRCLHMWS